MARQVGPYTVLEKLGQGGMGTVFRARRDDLQKDFALKVIARKSGSLENEKRFKREAQAAAKLSEHPGIVGVHDVGETEKYVYFAMDVVEGGAMNERLKAGELSFDEAAQLIEEAAEAVQFAHDRGILHRDIKPANIMIGHDGSARVADFGLAKSSDTDSETAKLTRSGQVLGTPAYMSPEQASGTQVDARSDIYSLGASLYEALAGEPPFLGDTVYAILAQLLKDEPKPPVRVDPDCPKALSNIAMKCLEKKPALRYQTAGELAQDLERYRLGEAVGARSKSAWQTASVKAVRSPAVIGGVVAAVLAVIATLAFVLPGSGASEAEAAAAKKKARLAAKRAEAAKAEAAAKEAAAKAQMGEISAWADVLETIAEEGRASDAAEFALKAFTTRFPKSSKGAEAQRLLDGIPALRADAQEVAAAKKLDQLIVAAAESKRPQDRDAILRFLEEHGATAAADRARAWLERNPATTFGTEPASPGPAGEQGGPQPLDLQTMTLEQAEQLLEQGLRVGHLQMIVDAAKVMVRIKPDDPDAQRLLEAGRHLKRAWVALDKNQGSKADHFLKQAEGVERLRAPHTAITNRRNALWAQHYQPVVVAPDLAAFLAAGTKIAEVFPEHEQAKHIQRDVAQLTEIRSAIDRNDLDEARRLLEAQRVHPNIQRHVQQLADRVPGMELRSGPRPPDDGSEPETEPQYPEARATTDASRKATLAGLPRALQRLVEKADDPLAVLDGRRPLLTLPGLLQRGDARWNGIFSPDGKLIRTLGSGGQVHVYSLDRAKAQFTITWDHFIAALDTKATGATDVHAQFSPDGRMLLCWSKQYRGAVVWAATGRGRPLFIDTGKGPQHQSKPNRAFWFGKRQVLVMGGRRTDLWSPGRRRPERIATDHQAIWDLCPLGTEILARNNDQGALRRAPKAGAELVPLAGERDRFRAAVYSPDGRWVATVDERDWGVRIWDRKGLELKRRFPGVRRGRGIRRPRFSPDGSALYLGRSRRILRYLVEAPLEDATTKEYWLAGGASTVAFDQDGTVMLGADRDGFTVWDLRTDEVVLRGTTPGSGVFAAIGPHGRIVATHNGPDDTTHLWVVPQPAK